VGNKVRDEHDITFLKKHLGKHLAGIFSFSPFVRSLEQGAFPNISALEVENRKVIETLVHATNTQEKDWGKYLADAVTFHEKNALAWANVSLGKNLMEQVDPNFHYPSV
jgi:CO dehydrogenase maturation factor